MERPFLGMSAPTMVQFHGPAASEAMSVGCKKSAAVLEAGFGALVDSVERMESCAAAAQYRLCCSRLSGRIEYSRSFKRYVLVSGRISLPKKAVKIGIPEQCHRCMPHASIMFPSATTEKSRAA